MTSMLFGVWVMDNPSRSHNLTKGAVNGGDCCSAALHQTQYGASVVACGIYGLFLQSNRILHSEFYLHPPQRHCPAEIAGQAENRWALQGDWPVVIFLMD
jgi:hypothetical protein